jgi:Fe-Mn family superoxide dismutase
MFTLPSLPYDYSVLEPFIDEATMHIHHDKHHQAYIDNLNKLVMGSETIEELLNSGNPKIKNNAGGHYNHSFFWTIMAPPDGAKPFEKILALREEFDAAALSHFGSGWAWIVINNGKLEVIDTSNQDSPVALGKTPILGIDVWEHAYYLKYKNMRADYIKAWWNVVNWKKVEELYESGVKTK